MIYLVYTCTKTKALCARARAEGFQTWVPIEKIRITRRPRSKAPYVEEITQAAIPGYIFVPEAEHERFAKWCPFEYRISALMTYDIPQGVPDEYRGLYAKHASVTLDELHLCDEATQQVLDQLRDVTGDRTYRVGDKVLVPFGPEKIEGMVIKLQGHGTRARVSTKLGFVNQVDLARLQKL